MLTKVPCDLAPRGYETYQNVRLRPETADRYLTLKKLVNDAGGLLLSAGGTRELSAKVTPGRSKTSMHYLGRAFDLPPYAGAFNPRRDPYLVTQSREVLFRGSDYPLCVEVYDLGSVKRFQESGERFKVEDGSFGSFTELALHAGFTPIPPRSGYTKGHYGSMEWWHFEDRNGLNIGDPFLDLIDATHGKNAHTLLPHYRELTHHTWNGTTF